MFECPQEKLKISYLKIGVDGDFCVKSSANES
jgi:hypothetical protein